MPGLSKEAENQKMQWTEAEKLRAPVWAGGRVEPEM